MGRGADRPSKGTLSVHVLGGWLFPRSIMGKFTIIMAILRQLHLVFSFLLASYMRLFAATPLLSLFILPLDKPYNGSKDWSIRRQLPAYDVVVVDQLSACIPLLRWYGLNRVIFYCHFPDLLLSPSAAGAVNERAAQPSLGNLVRSLYRAPIDALEEVTTGEADKILVNSNFTAEVFCKTFEGLRRVPRVVYPGIDVEAYAKPAPTSSESDLLL